MKVLITAEAEADLEAIGDYIARDNPARALSFVRELYQRECPTFCVSLIWSMLPERSKDDDDFQRTAGRVAEGLQAA